MGEVKQRLCQVAGKLGADVLVMGSHGHGFFERYNCWLSNLWIFILLFFFVDIKRVGLLDGLDEFGSFAWISADLIILNRLCRLIVRSVSDHCCQNAHCPVVVVNQNVCYS